MTASSSLASVVIRKGLFEKFAEVNPVLGVQMKAVGETMAIGRNFRAAWQKGLRGLEIGRAGWVTGERLDDDGLESDSRDHIIAALRRPTADRPGRGGSIL